MQCAWQTALSWDENEKRFSHSRNDKNEDKIRETNTLHIHKAINMFNLTSLWSKKATPEQSHDLLKFRSIGQEAFEAHEIIISTQYTRSNTQKITLYRSKEKN